MADDILRADKPVTPIAAGDAYGSGTGYRGVRFHKRVSTKPYQAVASREMARVLGLPSLNLGCFATAEEAGATHAQLAMEVIRMKTGKEVKLTHEGEQLFLCAANQTGYMGVKLEKRLQEWGRPLCFSAQAPASKEICGDLRLGYYASAEDAAAEYARYVRERRIHGHAEALANNQRRLALRRDRAREKHAQDAASRGLVTEVDGLRLELAPGSKSGYVGVTQMRNFERHRRLNLTRLRSLKPTHPIT